MGGTVLLHKKVTAHIFALQLLIHFGILIAEKRCQMSEQKRKRINYSVVCVSEFAKKNKLSSQDAFRFLYDYKGLDFLDENYEIEHTLSLNDAIADLEQVCRNNGGVLA